MFSSTLRDIQVQRAELKRQQDELDAKECKERERIAKAVPNHVVFGDKTVVMLCTDPVDDADDGVVQYQFAGPAVYIPWEPTYLVGQYADDGGQMDVSAHIGGVEYFSQSRHRMEWGDMDGPVDGVHTATTVCLWIDDGVCFRFGYFPDRKSVVLLSVVFC